MTHMHYTSGEGEGTRVSHRQLTPGKLTPAEYDVFLDAAYILSAGDAARRHGPVDELVKTMKETLTVDERQLAVAYGMSAWEVWKPWGGAGRADHAAGRGGGRRRVRCRRRQGRRRRQEVQRAGRRLRGARVQRTRNCSGRWRAADAAVGEVSALQENLAAKEPKVEETRELKAAWMETLGDFFGVGELARGPKSPTALLRRALLTTTYI